MTSNNWREAFIPANDPRYSQSASDSNSYTKQGSQNNAVPLKPSSESYEGFTNYFSAVMSGDQYLDMARVGRKDIDYHVPGSLDSEMTVMEDPCYTQGLNAASRPNAFPLPYESPVPDPSEEKVGENPLVLIKPTRPVHTLANQKIIGHLPNLLQSTIQYWSGEALETQESVLHKMIEALPDELREPVNDVSVDDRDLDSSLQELCSPTGWLCSIVKVGSNSGIISIQCNYAIKKTGQNGDKTIHCEKVFGKEGKRNPIEKFSEHLITYHWNIRPFRCFACSSRFARAFSRDHHEKAVHNSYRPKAYAYATKKSTGIEP